MRHYQAIMTLQCLPIMIHQSNFFSKHFHYYSNGFRTQSSITKTVKHATCGSYFDWLIWT